MKNGKISIGGLSSCMLIRFLKLAIWSLYFFYLVNIDFFFLREELKKENDLNNINKDNP